MHLPILSCSINGYKEKDFLNCWQNWNLATVAFNLSAQEGILNNLCSLACYWYKVLVIFPHTNHTVFSLLLLFSSKKYRRQCIADSRQKRHDMQMRWWLGWIHTNDVMGVFYRFVLGLWVESHLATDLYTVDCRGHDSVYAAVSPQTAAECCPESTFITPDTIWSPRKTWANTPHTHGLYRHRHYVHICTSTNLHTQITSNNTNLKLVTCRRTYTGMGRLNTWIKHIPSKFYTICTFCTFFAFPDSNLRLKRSENVHI